MGREVSDSEHSLGASSHSLVWIEHSVSLHHGADHESLSISDWESSVVGLVILDLNHLDLGDGPSLVITIVAFLEGHWSVVGIASLDSEAEALVVSDVPLATRVEVEDLLLLTSPGSDDGDSVNVESLALLVGDSKVSGDSTSHGLGSSVEDEPGSLVLWVGVLNSKSELSVADVLIVEELSVARHLGLQQELYSMCDWLNLGFTSLLCDSSDALGVFRSQCTFLQLVVELSIHRVLNALAL